VAAGEDLEKRVVDVVTGSRGRRRGGRGQRKGKLMLNKLRICTGRHSREFILGFFRRRNPPGTLPISVGWHTYQAEVTSLMGRESRAMLAKSGLTSRINGKEHARTGCFRETTLPPSSTKQHDRISPPGVEHISNAPGDDARTFGVDSDATEIISGPADTSVKPSQVLSASSETHKDSGVPRTDPAYRLIDLQISSVERRDRKRHFGSIQAIENRKRTATGGRF